MHGEYNSKSSMHKNRSQGPTAHWSQVNLYKAKVHQQTWAVQVVKGVETLARSTVRSVTAVQGIPGRKLTLGPTVLVVAWSHL